MLLLYNKAAWSYYNKAAWSYSWRSLITAIKDLEKGLSWRIGNEQKVDFWREKWLERRLNEEEQLHEVPNGV